LWNDGPVVNCNRGASKAEVKASSKERVNKLTNMKQLSVNLTEEEFIESRHSVQKMNKAIYLPQRKPSTLGQKTTFAPAVCLPLNSEQSINPGQEIYDDAVMTVVAEESMKELVEANLIRRMKPMTSKLLDFYSEEELALLDEKTKIREFKRLLAEEAKFGSEGGNDGKDGSKGKSLNAALTAASKLRNSAEVKAAELAAKILACNPRKTTSKDERLTRTEKNKRARLETEAKEMSLQKKQKLLDKSIGQVPNLLREMKELDAKREQQRHFKKELLEVKKGLEMKDVIRRGKKFGRSRFHEEVGFQQDLLQKSANSGLRTATTGSAILDRAKSLYRRNLLEQPNDISKGTLDRLKKKGKRMAKKHKNMWNRGLML